MVAPVCKAKMDTWCVANCAVGNYLSNMCVC